LVPLPSLPWTPEKADTGVEQARLF
jgi:hypothetical protein